MAEDKITFTIGTNVVDSMYFGTDAEPDLKSILLKAIKAGTDTPENVYPITRADKVRGLQNILNDIADKIDANKKAAAAANTTVVSGKDGENDILVISSEENASDKSVTYTVGLPTFTIGTDAQGTNALYKITVDKYGRVTAANAVSSSDVLALNTGTDEANNIASEAKARELAKTLSSTVGSVSEDADGKLNVTVQNSDDNKFPTAYSVSLEDINSAFSVVTGTDAEGHDVYGSGLAKITVDKFGRVTATAVPTQKDIIALASGTEDKEILVTRNDVNWIANSMQSLLQNTNAMQYQGIITSANLDAAVISDALNAYNGGTGTVSAKPGDTFMIGTDIPVGNITTADDKANKIIIANGNINLEAGDMLVCVTSKATTDEPNPTPTFYVIQKNIDGAVTTGTSFSQTGQIIISGENKTVVGTSIDSLRLVRTDRAITTGNIVIGTNGSWVEDSLISIADVDDTIQIASAFNTALGSATAGQVLTKTADGYKFADTHIDPELSLADTTVKLTVKNNGGAASEVGAVTFTAGAAITLTTSADADSITINHAAVGAAETTVTATSDTVANGGDIVIPTIGIDKNGHVATLSASTVTLPAYSGTANQIVLNNNVFGLATATASATTGTAVEAKIGSSFSAITGVTTDDYGRVTDVTTTQFTIPGISVETLNTVRVSTVAENAEYNITGASSIGVDTGLNADGALTFTVGTSGVTLKIGTDKNPTTISGGVFSGSLSKTFTVGSAEYNGSADVTVGFGTGVEMDTDNIITLSTTLDFGKEGNVVIGTTATVALSSKSNGGPLTVPQLTIDNYGRVTEVGAKELELPKTYISVGDTTFVAPDAEVTITGGGTDHGINLPFGTGIEVYDNKICGALTYEFVDA